MVLIHRTSSDLTPLRHFAQRRPVLALHEGNVFFIDQTIGSAVLPGKREMHRVSLSGASHFHREGVALWFVLRRCQYRYLLKGRVNGIDGDFALGGDFS